MKRQVISTDKGPRTGLPYLQAVRHGDLVFVAGQVALDPVLPVPVVPPCPLAEPSPP